MDQIVGVNRRSFLKLAGLAGGAAMAVSLPATVAQAAGALPGGRTVALRQPVYLEETPLPEPKLAGTMSLEQALATRRSQRRFAADPLTMAQIGQLLWAAQGITDSSGKRTAPSAMSTYPLEVYIAWTDGYAHYSPAGHVLQVIGREDVRAGAFSAAAAAAPAVFVVAGAFDRVAERLRANVERWVQMEAGHAAQNLLLQAVALGLVGVPQGGMQTDRIRAAIGIPEGEVPLYQIPVGRPAG
jgi:SagB-type dehydrogenase family enzyme